MNKVYKGDVGTEIVLDCGSDISNATTMEILVLLPDGNTTTWSATLEGTDSVKYVIQSGDLDMVGMYMLQAKVVTPDWSGRGETFYLRVLDHYQ